MVDRKTNTSPSPPLPRPSTHSKQLATDPEAITFAGVMADHMQIRGLQVDNQNTCDFRFGSPQEMPSPELVRVFQGGLTPKSPEHYAYRTNSSGPRDLLAKFAVKRYAFEQLDPEDIFFTTGNNAGIAIALQLVVEPDDKVIYMEPGWFFYRRLILNARGIPTPIRMPLDSSVDDDDTSDMRAFLDAIDDKTKVLILNSPHNPTGKVYSRKCLEQLSERLLDISRKRGYPLYVLADEAYSDFVFDGLKHETIAAFYPYTLLAYTYNKFTLAPSQRVGYLILSPLMPNREELRGPVLALQITLTWCFPNADMMESIPQLEIMRDNFDTSVMSRRRDRMRDMLQEIGFELLVEPKGSFYMLAKTPIKDDVEFCRELAKRNVLVLPGTLFNTPECFRISLTATDESIERSANVFRECFENAAPNTKV